MNYEKIGLQLNEGFLQHISPQQVLDIAYSIVQASKLLLRLAGNLFRFFDLLTSTCRELRPKKHLLKVDAEKPLNPNNHHLNYRPLGY